MSERKKRNIVIGTLCGVLLLMAVGYAAFNTLLTINGTTSITSNWNIKITEITSKGIVGKASDEESQVVDDLKATFKANLVSPGDSITYDITVENKGNINAELSSISMSENTNDSIKIETSVIAEGDKLNPSSTATLSVKVTYSDDVTTQPDNLKAEVTVTLNYVQEGMTSSLPETVDFETESTTRAIIVTAPKIEGATYEFQKDTEGWVSNEDQSNNVYTFDQITHNTEHNIQVRVTKESKVIESEVKQVRTLLLENAASCSASSAPVGGQAIFPEGCSNGLTCNLSVSGCSDCSSVCQGGICSCEISNSSGGRTTVSTSISDGYNTVTNSCQEGGLGTCGGSITI